MVPVGKRPSLVQIRRYMSLQTLSPDCTVEEIAAAMERDGAVIIRDVLSPEKLKALQEDVAPWIEQTAEGLDDWSGRKTKRTGGLIARCPTVREIAVNPLILGAANATLSPYCSKIHLNITQLITILPGQTAQIALVFDRTDIDLDGGPVTVELFREGKWAFEFELRPDDIRPAKTGGEH